MLKMLMLLLVLVVLFCSQTLGQITIPTNDFSPPLGTATRYSGDVSMNETFYNSLIAGSGGPMLWDFSSRSYTITYTQVVVDPATTPAIDSFPNANLVQVVPAGSDSSWTIYNSVPGSFTFLGSVAHVLSTEYTIVRHDIAPDWVFPIVYNGQWTSYRHWTETYGQSYTRVFDTTYNTVDAWGTAKYGSNSVPCLRVMSEERILRKTYDDSNVLLNSSLMEIFTVNFVAAGFNWLVSATKVAIPSSASYSSVAWDGFLSKPTDVKQDNTGTLPTGFDLSQNYPNPFNPRTEIRLSVPTNSHVKLVVYDILGREVRVIIDQTLAAGSYVADWDGKNHSGEQVASGIYFYRLMADQFIETRKMVLFK